MTTRQGLGALPDGIVDVLVVGGGPSGLFLAADLASRGIASVVVEPRVELDRLRPRAKTTNARTMTHLRRLGLASALREAAPLDVAYSQSVVFCTALDGHEIIRFDEAFQLCDARYAPAPECGQQVAQPVVEEVLRDAVAAEDLVALHLGVGFVRTVPSGSDDVVAAVVADEQGRERVVRCRHLVGADGVASTVRKDLGLRLEGSSAAKSNLGLLFRAPGLAERVAIDPAVQYWVVGRPHAGMIGQLDTDDLWWAIVHGYDAEAPAFTDVAEADLVRSLTGVADLDVEVLAVDPWTARMLLAPRYRVGRTFLVGDAAHANPPWGGHGFNTCIGDAANLAWKLAAVLHGWGGADLLDSYEAERRPVAQRTIDDATSNGRLLADDLLDPALDEDGARGDAARRTAEAALAVKASEFHSLGLVLGYDYADSPLVTAAGGPAPAPHPIRYEPSAAPGCLLPHAWLASEASLYDLLGPDLTLLVDVDALAADDVRQLTEVAGQATAPCEVRPIAEPAVSALWQAPLVLVRADQHVAWRGHDVTQLQGALQRAAGVPVVSATRAALVGS